MVKTPEMEAQRCFTTFGGQTYLNSGGNVRQDNERVLRLYGILDKPLPIKNIFFRLQLPLPAKLKMKTSEMTLHTCYFIIERIPVTSF